MPDLYANIVGANVTPFELNLVFSRAAVPVELREDEEIKLLDTLRYVARVALPLQVLHPLIKLLEGQFEVAKKRGFIELAAEEAKK